MVEPDFRAGDVTIRYLDDHPLLLQHDDDEHTLRAAALAAALLEDEARSRRGHQRIDVGTTQGGRWRNMHWR
jgi:acetyl-CoA carboxylase biotin carboxylase subunit